MATTDKDKQASGRKLVLAALKKAGRKWLDTATINAIGGGTEGTRRLRELKEERYGGYKYEMRRKEGSTQYEYRLVK